MKKQRSISIPKPCHEDWQNMTPNQKGRFCQACSKTVIDFTTMNTAEIQHFFQQKSSTKSVCGRFKTSQLEQLKIEIPQQVFNQNINFNTLFLLVLLVCMGTTLMSCQQDNNTRKKIDAVEIIETKGKVEKDSANTTKNTNTFVNNSRVKTKPPKPPTPVLTGVVVVGIVESPTTNKVKTSFSFFEIENPPEFKNTPNSLSVSEKKAYFKTKISAFVNTHFKVPESSLGLTGKQRIYTQFSINKYGIVSKIKTRATHPNLEAEAKRVLQLLPKFKPGTQKGKAVKTLYSLPIIVDIKD